MKKIKFILFFCLFSFFVHAQNTDSTSSPAPQSQPQPAQQPGADTHKYPKGYNDYRNGKSTKDQKPFSDQVYYGCNLALRAAAYNGYNVVYYDVSPQVGYKFSDKLSAGFQFIYNNTIATYGGRSLNYNIIGGGVFGRALITRNLFIQAEYDILSVPADYLGTAITRRSTSDEKMAGLGYRNMWGDKLSYYLVLMYDFAPALYSPYYNSPLVYRAGLAWNF